MVKQTVTRRQKDVSRLVREKNQIQKDLAKKTFTPSPPPPQEKIGRKKKPAAPPPLLSEADFTQICREGLTVKQVTTQIDLFKSGVPYIHLNRPCRLNDGIDTIPEDGQLALTALHDEASATGRLCKFVPASGAASRMFMTWYRYLEEGRIPSTEEEIKLVSDLDRYPFRADLEEVIAKAGFDLSLLLSEKRYADLLSFVLTPRGLNYGQLPKALLKFHAYPSGNRTAIEEHLVETALYTRDIEKNCRLHITVSENHRTVIQDLLHKVVEHYEGQYDANYDIHVSVQESSTNTIAVDLKNRPFRLEDGHLCFRPGGHGALLENLNAIDGDIIFIKNIDNIVPDRLKTKTVLYKKLLCGYLISLQKEIFRFLNLMDENRLNDRQWTEVLAFCQEKLHIVFPACFAAYKSADGQALVFKALNRPLRVCGMVKNEGEPGGGPFWVDENDSSQSLQIIEAIQVDPHAAEQKTLWQGATHFNPVDLICAVRDFRGEKFDLRRYVNPQTASITQKSEKGKDLKALEHPGLWNGSMADWITVFVEVPIETFNPVKTIDDLLRPAHQPA